MSIPGASDLELVTAYLGRAPEGEFTVVVRSAAGRPMVIENAPLLRDGRPMPTRYWLVDPELRAEVSRLESQGGVNRAEAEVDADAIADAHQRAAREREALLKGHVGPAPSGGVGGTRTGVKCLHAHLATFLVDGVDPVGQWTARQLGLVVAADEDAHA